MKIEAASARWLVSLGYHLLQLWVRTLRFQVEDPSDGLSRPVTIRYIGALWHNRLLLLPFILRKYLPERRGAALISASRDGDVLAALVRRFGFDVVRGSSSRRGAAAIVELTDVIASGGDVVITPDGPRGPAYQIGGGIVYLAQRAGVAVVPINFEYSSCWRVKSWDRFILPRPFSTVRVIIGFPHHVAPTTNDAEFESERVRLQNAMMQIVEMR